MREEFYDLAWSKPMTQLAKEFALSDVALHKPSATRMVGEEERREADNADAVTGGNRSVVGARRSLSTVSI